MIEDVYLINTTINDDDDKNQNNTVVLEQDNIFNTIMSTLKIIAFYYCAIFI